MKIEVFGPGCAKCARTAEIAAAFLEKRGVAGEVVKITELTTMADRGVLRTPTTMVDGETIVVGRVLRETDLDKWIARRESEA